MFVGVYNAFIYMFISHKLIFLWLEGLDKDNYFANDCSEE